MDQMANEAVGILDRRAAMVVAAQHHFDADMLVKGTYGKGIENFRGCSVGCFAHEVSPKKRVPNSNIHKFVADHYGYPEWLALLQDTIFEGLPNGPKGENSKWHVQLAQTLAALPVEFDWTAALHRVHAAILQISYVTAGTAQEAVKAVLDLHERAGRGEVVGDELWSAVRSAVRSAADAAGSAAYAARSAVRSAVRSAADAAGSAAESAAWSATWSAAESAARSAAFLELRDAILAALPEPMAA
jgi:hypothetical protein